MKKELLYFYLLKEKLESLMVLIENYSLNKTKMYVKECLDAVKDYISKVEKETKN